MNRRDLIRITTSLVLLLILACMSVRADEPLQDGVPTETTLPPATYTNYYLDVATGATGLTITITDGEGDLDLFVRYGSPFAATTYGELYDQADIFSDGLGADETITITGTTMPSLIAGRWYIAPANLNETITGFRIIATIESTAQAHHQLEIELSSNVATPGLPLSWTLVTIPGSVTDEADLYAGIVIPRGTLFFLGSVDLTDVTTQAVPYQIKIPAKPETTSPVTNLVLPGPLPAGDYRFANVLVKSFANPYDPNSWLSNLALESLSFSPLSPAQQAYIGVMGRPDEFIKTFHTDSGRIRVDETWIYIGQGQRVFFINGVFVDEETFDTAGRTPQPQQYRPESYTFDSTPQSITARHGQPLQISDVRVGGGPFFDEFSADSSYIYDGITFGFSDNRLVFVIPSQ